MTFHRVNPETSIIFSLLNAVLTRTNEITTNPNINLDAKNMNVHVLITASGQVTSYYKGEKTYKQYYHTPAKEKKEFIKKSKVNGEDFNMIEERIRENSGDLNENQIKARVKHEFEILGKAKENRLSDTRHLLGR